MFNLFKKKQPITTKTDYKVYCDYYVKCNHCETIFRVEARDEVIITLSQYNVKVVVCLHCNQYIIVKG